MKCIGGRKLLKSLKKGEIFLSGATTLRIQISANWNSHGYMGFWLRRRTSTLWVVTMERISAGQHAVPKRVVTIVAFGAMI